MVNSIPQKSKIADFIYHLRNSVEKSPAPANPVTVVCISDTHNQQPILPPGDLLLHAGDLTAKGTFQEIQFQIDWLDRQSFQHKVIIAGNHDFLLDPNFVDRFPHRIIERPGSSRSDLQWKSVIYLQDESFSAIFSSGRRLKIYGSPWTPQYGAWAFQYPSIRNVHDRRVPSDAQILLTHGPPSLHLDSEQRERHVSKGCHHLLREIWRLRKSLKLVVFGHIHGGYGTEFVQFDNFQTTYDSLRLGRSELFGVLMMVLLLFWSWLMDFLGFAIGKRRGKDTMLLANAAVKSEPGKAGPNRPLVFQL